MMRTIQMTIDEPLLNQVDQVISELRSTRSEFIREALKLALQRHSILQQELRHAQGYSDQPPSTADIDDWTEVQVWGDV